MKLSNILTLSLFCHRGVYRLFVFFAFAFFAFVSFSQAQIRNAVAEAARNQFMIDIQDARKRAMIINKFQLQMSLVPAEQQLKNAEIVLVGSGPHTLIYLNGLLEASLNPEELAKKIVVIEAQDFVGGNFLNGQWHLNSKVFDSGIETNELPHALFQISNFVAGHEFPMAYHMGEAVALNFMVLAQQGVRFVTNTELKTYQVIDSETIHLSLETKSGKKIEKDVSFLGLGTGLGFPSVGRITDPATQAYIQTQVANNTDLETFKSGVIDSHVWLTNLHQMPAAKVEELVRGGDIAVIGYRHTATVAAESLLGSVRDRDSNLIQRTASKVTMYGLKAKTGEEFLDAARLGGTEEVSPAYYKRNVALGLPAAIDTGFVQGVPAYVQKMIPSKDGVTIVYEQDGKIIEKKHKIVILAVGQNNEVFNYGQSSKNLKIEMKPVVQEMSGIKQEVGKQVVVVSEAGVESPVPVMIYGTAANQKIEPDFLNLSLVRGRNSVDVQKQLTWQMALHAMKNFFNPNSGAGESIMCVGLF